MNLGVLYVSILQTIMRMDLESYLLIARLDRLPNVCYAVKPRG